VLSHQGLDAITHHDGLVVRLIPALSGNIHFMASSIPVFYGLQIIFSMIGLILVYLHVVRLPSTGAASTTKIDYRYWIAFTLIFFAIVCVRLMAWPQFNSYGGIAIAIMGAILYSWLAATLIFKSKIINK
jgi:uncharacterized membrane protein